MGLFGDKGTLVKSRGGWSAVAASLVASAAMIYAQVTETHGQAPEPQSRVETTKVNPPPAPPGPAPGGGARVATPAEVESLAANAPSPGQQFQVALSSGVASEDRLQVKTIWAARVIEVLFPQIKTIYGYRQDALPWHPNGLAIDVMIPDHNSPEGIELGNQIAGFALANAKRWGINHVIWRQKIYLGPTSGSWMAGLGNETANHYDHVHICTDGGGYPTGHETYYIGSMTQ